MKPTRLSEASQALAEEIGKLKLGQPTNLAYALEELVRAIITEFRAVPAQRLHDWDYQGIGRSVCQHCHAVFLGNTDERPAGPCYGPARPAEVAAPSDLPLNEGAAAPVQCDHIAPHEDCSGCHARGVILPPPPPPLAPVNRYSVDGIFVGDPASRFFVEAQRRHGVWTFFLPRPESAQEARWFAAALQIAAAESERPP